MGNGVFNGEIGTIINIDEKRKKGREYNLMMKKLLNTIF